jgi:hypothetical protein
MVANDVSAADAVRDALAAFCSSLNGRIGRRLAAIYLLDANARGARGASRDVDVAIILTDEIGAQEKMDIAEMAADASEKAGVLMREWPISAFQWSHPEAYVNPRFISKLRRVSIPLEVFIGGLAKPPVVARRDS